jgi:pentatricopeptide repeat domain-containing protein 1
VQRPAQAYTALLGSAVKCGEAELAVDVYSQLRAQGFQLERHVFHVVLEVFLKLGRWQDALSVMDDMAAQVLQATAASANGPQQCLPSLCDGFAM